MPHKARQFPETAIYKKIKLSSFWMTVYNHLLYYKIKMSYCKNRAFPTVLVQEHKTFAPNYRCYDLLHHTPEQLSKSTWSYKCHTAAVVEDYSAVRVGIVNSAAFLLHGKLTTIHLSMEQSSALELSPTPMEINGKPPTWLQQCRHRLKILYTKTRI